MKLFHCRPAEQSVHWNAMVQNENFIQFYFGSKKYENCSTFGMTFSTEIAFLLCHLESSLIKLGGCKRPFEK